MTSFIPLQRMRDRITLDKDDSEIAYFTSILYGYEFAIKLVTSAFVAAINDDADRHRYRIEYNLVRASGIGDWATALNDIFTGPSSAHLDAKAREYRNEITAKVAQGDWRYEATRLLRTALIELAIETEGQGTKAQLLQWFRDFALLRNKTRGHGAPSQTRLANACQPLEESWSLVVDNLSLYSIPWAYLRRNLSLKYRVCPLGDDDSPFAHMRVQKDINYEDGVYVAFDILRLCRLIHSNQDLSDFFVANGGFTGQKYEVLSYISGEIQHASADPYLKPSERLPGSQTEGKGQLDIVGEAFSNLPDPTPDYVTRDALEGQLRGELCATSRHPIVTLDGRGGIGKTSTALHVVSDLAQSADCPFTVILWFSARDIDLMPEGAKLVRPSGITIDDFARQYAELLDIPRRKERTFNARENFAHALSGETTDTTLFVFDNFETVVSPAEAFGWIDTYLRPPNKVLITTRIRGNFKADFPIHVEGMTESECKTLILSTAQRLGIRGRIDHDFMANIISESEGHPYVIKVLLGEVARSPSTKKVARVIASRDDILEALFERTFDAISPPARRVFLTLAGWRSVVPELAVEAVVVRPGNERMDVHKAIQELVNSSLVDEIGTSKSEYFLSVPLAAQPSVPT